MSLMPFNPSTLLDPWSSTSGVEDPFTAMMNRQMGIGMGGVGGTKGMSPLISSDLIEMPTEYHVHADLPGVELSDLDVSIQDNILIMKAERKHVHETTTDTVHSMERTFGRVSRRIALPRDADLEQVSTKFKNGVLTVIVPKLAAGRPSSRKLTIDYE
ncbi:HSP20-like chaperone [Ochromonadaceae sp. CCMP2298]|nr:HSP20-like chaperone [Ochromonadaceae sp. CCMP2298]